LSTTAPEGAQVPAQHASAAEAGEHRRIDLDAPPAAPGPGDATLVRDAIHAVLCVLSGVLITIGFALDNAKGVSEGAELIALVTEEPGRFYWSNMVGAFGLVLVAAVGLAVMRLVTGRGRVVATVGGLLLIVGGAAAAAGQAMYAAVVTAMTESGQDATVTAALQDHFGESVRTGSRSSSASPGSCSGSSSRRPPSSSHAPSRGGCRRLWSPALSRSSPSATPPRPRSPTCS
jgi:hypothetical protein